MRRAGNSWLACLAAFVLPTAAHAASIQVPIGPRAIGLGGAYVSLADDATALYWNPAGLASVGHQELTATHADLFGTGVRDNFAAFAVPLSAGLAAAADWYHSGFDDGELGFRENRVDAGFGMELRSHLLAGLNAKLLTRSLDLDATSLAASRGLGFDAGLLFAPAARWRLGAVAQDVFGTRLRDADGTSQVAYPRALRFGASWAPRRWGLLTGQLDDRWHLGFEGAPVTGVALRFGVQGDRRASEGATWSAGLGLKAGVLRVDWAREFPPTLASTDHYAAAFEFNFNPPLVRVERPHLDELYASLQRTYATEPFGTLRVRNLQDRSIESTVSVFIPELMDRPSEHAAILRAHAVTDVPLTAVLGERAARLVGDRAVQVQIATRYASARLMRNERVNVSTLAYAPGALDWGRGMAQAAAFVTPRDPVVESLARIAARAVSDGPLARHASRNLALMAAMVDAVATVGVAYVPDPQNPFASVSEAPHAVDTIYYPSQTLARRTGDCDDTTVLLASLLASVGVRTQFVDAPGHIFLVADTDVDERNALGLGVDSTRYVVLDHEVWIPIETTLTSRGFLEAWRSGAAQLAEIHDPHAFVDVGEAQTRYEPVLPPLERAAQPLDERGLRTRLDADATGLAAARDEFFGARFGGSFAEVQVSAEAAVDLARVHVEAGDLTGARTLLDQALARAPQSGKLHNDLGVVLVGLDSLGEAESHMHAALALGDAAPGAWLNLGLVRWLRGDSTTALDLMRRGIRAAGGLEAALTALPASQPALDGDEPSEEARPALQDLVRRAEARARGKAVGGETQVPRLAVLPSGARARDATPPSPAWCRLLVWWQ